MSNVSVKEIIVRASTSDKYGAVQAVIDYINDLRNYCHYETEELPVNALRTYYLDYYMSQVERIGHGQFQPSDIDMKYIRDGIAAIALEPFVTIFKEFETYRAERKKQSPEVNEAREIALNRFDHMNAQKTLLPANDSFIRSDPNFRSVPNEQYETELERLKVANALWLPRLRMRLRKENQWKLAEPYIVAAGILSNKTGMRAESLRTKWQGTSWAHSAAENLRKFDGVGLEGTNSRMYLEGNDYVLRETSRQGRVLGRAPMSLVDEAVAAVKRAPVVEAAEFAVPKVSGNQQSNANLIECGGKDEAGAFVWIVFSADVPYRMTRSGGIIRIQAPDGRAAEMTGPELERYISASTIDFKDVQRSIWTSPLGLW
jgi:hypothetical protein